MRNLAACGRPLKIQCWRFLCWRNLPPLRQNTARSRHDWPPRRPMTTPPRVARLNKEQNELSPVVETYRSYLAARERLAPGRGSCCPTREMRELAQEELLQTNAELERLERDSFSSCSCPRTPMTTRMSLWRSGPAWAGRRRPCSPTPCTGCTLCTPSAAAGKQRWTA